MAKENINNLSVINWMALISAIAISAITLFSCGMPNGENGNRVPGKDEQASEAPADESESENETDPTGSTPATPPGPQIPPIPVNPVPPVDPALVAKRAELIRRIEGSWATSFHEEGIFYVTDFLQLTAKKVKIEKNFFKNHRRNSFLSSTKQEGIYRFGEIREVMIIDVDHPGAPEVRVRALEIVMDLKKVGERHAEPEEALGLIAISSNNELYFHANWFVGENRGSAQNKFPDAILVTGGLRGFVRQ